MSNFDERKSLEIMRDQLNEVGPGFCAAKWFMSTIWLQDGRTSSCHHPPAHHISDDDIKDNPSGLHNTAHKKKQRKEMIHERRPDECSYCWQVEDYNVDDTSFSDRVIKSSVISWHDIFRDVVNWETYPDDVLTITSDAYKRNFNPRILEISFDNLCNLNCSYCNSDFSSTWAKDLKVNGPYENLQTTNRGTWEEAVKFEYDPIKSDNNPYVNAFFEWFDDGLKDDLKELRVTGGEPMRSPNFWKLVNMCHERDTQFTFSVNSNMMASKAQLDDLIAASSKFSNFELFTSCESHGTHAEFIRHGLDYEQWLNNIRYFIDNGSYSKVTLMLTINALSIFGLTDFLDDIVSLKKQYDDKSLMRMSVNILRFPNFQSVTILPLGMRIAAADKIERWLEKNKDDIEDGEAINIDRLIKYLTVVHQTYEDEDSYEDRINDFVNFYDQYARRNNMDIVESFSNAPEFIEWWDELYNKVMNT